MIENERKYVLKINSLVDFTHLKTKKIVQSYLSDDRRARIRKTGTDQFEFTYKIPINDALEEISRRLTTEEYERLLTGSVRTLTKTRFTHFDNEYQWDIDFFYDGDELYFALAECEMPVDSVRPDRIPDFISKNILYEVKITETEDFTSYSLGNVEYAKELYQEFA